MGPSYAGILGTLAYVIVILRGVLQGYAVEGTIKLSILLLFVFAAIGYVIGKIAESTIEDSIQVQLQRELEALEKTDEATSGN
ncbi:MAG: hypothetical protein VXY07_12385 [Planctomycetota bacterium]|jgi:O-antigen ligase|nr:hypothetical protein [Planctomycetota bacterium]MEC7450025.1 hypothetical protein [Planctomycetota bacterium]MEC7979690.1 hypothetical protein [Planctomycetota bacterium]MEC8344152.1 hypothetical protein [Planctomycetota bacterium]MEC8410859.1 hypothetical protein [Planctomycetota bacterium]